MALLGSPVRYEPSVVPTLWAGNLIKSRPLGLQAPLNPARPDLGSFTTEGEGGAPRCKIVVRFARGMVRPCAEEKNADLWRQEYRPLTQERCLIPTSHASFARSRLPETPANGAANRSMHSLRAILNNPIAISPNTDPSRRIASGWEPHHKNTDLSRKILSVQKTSAAEA